MNNDIDSLGIAGQHLINAVVDHLIDQMVQSIGSRRANVHGRALADGFEPLQFSELRRVVNRRDGSVERRSFFHGRCNFSRHRFGQNSASFYGLASRQNSKKLARWAQLLFGKYRPEKRNRLRGGRRPRPILCGVNNFARNTWMRRNHCRKHPYYDLISRR